MFTETINVHGFRNVSVRDDGYVSWVRDDDSWLSDGSRQCGAFLPPELAKMLVARSNPIVSKPQPPLTLADRIVADCVALEVTPLEAALVGQGWKLPALRKRKASRNPIKLLEAETVIRRSEITAALADAQRYWFNNEHKRAVVKLTGPFGSSIMLGLEELRRQRQVALAAASRRRLWPSMLAAGVRSGVAAVLVAAIVFGALHAERWWARQEPVAVTAPRNSQDAY